MNGAVILIYIVNILMMFFFLYYYYNFGLFYLGSKNGQQVLSIIFINWKLNTDRIHNEKYFLSISAVLIIEEFVKKTHQYKQLCQ